MRALPFLLALSAALAVAASAQTSEVTMLDRQIATLDRQIAQLDAEIRAVQSEVGRYGSRSQSLSEQSRAYQARVVDYRGRTYALQGRAAEVRDMYDDLARYGGSDADHRAYDDARYNLEAEAERLRDEAAELQRLADEISQSGRDSADRVDRVAVRGRATTQRRSALRHEREVLRLRRDRLAAPSEAPDRRE